MFMLISPSIAILKLIPKMIMNEIMISNLIQLMKKHLLKTTHKNQNDLDINDQNSNRVRDRGRSKLTNDGFIGRPKEVYAENAIAMDDCIPQTVEEALSSPNKIRWIKAINDEFEPLKVNKAWSLVDLPSGHKVELSK